ncbi:MAG: outer membrane lipoprotein-sorting protein [Gammaproteobacteria bacterium]|nr:outer membrane lipoprotein-sorting protein [Gammaproteobacteria bacterium]
MTKSIIKQFSFILLLTGSFNAGAEDARQLIKNAIDHFRGLSSYSEVSMVIHRPDWERTLDMKIWTRGLDRSLVRITAPVKDRGNGSLLIDNDMWTYAPKINRIIKIPASMANQSWMGSDFSNNDVARADDLIEKYNHRILQTQQQQDIKIYVIESIPHDDAPVVWGKEVITVREDYILLRHEFFDQDNQLVKYLVADDIKQFGDKKLATVERMQKVGVENEWTEFRLNHIKFNIELGEHAFSLSNLRNPRF